MAATLKINDSGTWRTVSAVKVNDGGTWRNIQSVKVNDGGTWRTVFQAFTVNGSFTAWSLSSAEPDGNAAGSDLTIHTDGTVTGGGSGTGSSDWGAPTTTGIGANYYVKFTPTSGSFTTNDAATFMQLSADKSCGVSGFTGSASCVFTIEIATDAAGTNIVLTSTGNAVEMSHF